MPSGAAFVNISARVFDNVVQRELHFRVVKPSRVTIKFLAAEAGMSFSTVAKALRHDPTIRQQTRQRILDLARAYNYRPNLLARGLRSQKTSAIGMILNDLQSPFYLEVYKAVEDVLNSEGYTLLLADSRYDETLEKRNISTMLSYGVAGIIISSVSEQSDNIDFLLGEPLKTVFIDNLPANPLATCVYVDHEEAARLGTEHLLSLGHKDILLLNGPQQLASAQHFRKGYVNTLSAHGITPSPSLIKHNPITIEDTCAAFDLIFQRQDPVAPDDFSAVLALSDVIAIGVYESAMRHSFSIPGTFSVVGYDNILATKYLNPALTTIHQPKQETGSLSVRLLLGQINGDAPVLRRVVLRPNLVIRNSTSPITRVR